MINNDHYNSRTFPLNREMNRAFHSSPPGQFPLFQIGTSTPWDLRIEAAVIIRQFNANALQSVDTAPIF